jgi:hypothetical protein
VRGAPRLPGSLPPLRLRPLPAGREAPPELREEPFLRGDVNGDGSFDVSDGVALLSWMLCAGGSLPLCLDAADVNDDGCVDIRDVVLFPGLCPFVCEPPPPFPECGSDPSADFLGCTARGLSCPRVPCELPPLEDDVLESLELFHSGALESRVLVVTTVSVEPGDEVEFLLGVWECCYFFDEVEACTEWSVEPAVHAVIDPAGLLRVNGSAPHGAAFSVVAVIEDGRAVLSVPVQVYTRALDPLVGIWRETAQLDCSAGEELAPRLPIEELFLDAFGSFSVTWIPFEVYTDYWGTYRYDLGSRTITFEVEGGNYVPDDIDGTGRFRRSNQGDLILEDVWLGTEPPFGGPQPPGPRRCGHRFEER